MGTMCQKILEDRHLMPTEKLNKAILRERGKIVEASEMLIQLTNELKKRMAEDSKFDKGC